jgi:GH24 family phage-related lysozyme (muramidase)
VRLWSLSLPCRACDIRHEVWPLLIRPCVNPNLMQLQFVSLCSMSSKLGVVFFLDSTFVHDRAGETAEAAFNAIDGRSTA